jgi:hypothetical protein
MVTGEEMSFSGTKAIVIRVNGTRFYADISKSKRLQTAWSIAGARLFGEWDTDEVLKIEIEIAKRGKKSERLWVTLNAEHPARYSK